MSVQKLTVKAKTQTRVEPEVPVNYWDFADLHLCPGKKCADGANADGKKPNTPRNYIEQLQKDLTELGYLDSAFKHAKGTYDDVTARAVLRFRRHARRVYRMKAGNPDDVKESDVFSGDQSRVCDHITATEIRKWVGKGWKVPLGRFRRKSLITEAENADGCPTPDHFQAQDRVADAWVEIVSAVREAGGRLGYRSDDAATYPAAAVRLPYTDTPRTLRRKQGDGASSRSFHYTGRAIDIAQYRAIGPAGHYFLVKDPQVVTRRNGKQERRLFWVIYCRVAEKTDAAEIINGSEDDGDLQPLPKKDPARRKYFNLYEQAENFFPCGYYVNLTELITAGGVFERIPAHDGWETHPKRQEWWHFQYVPDKQPTFLDECELFGISQEKLKGAGWDMKGLDGPPG